MAGSAWKQTFFTFLLYVSLLLISQGKTSLGSHSAFQKNNENIFSKINRRSLSLTGDESDWKQPLIYLDASHPFSKPNAASQIWYDLSGHKNNFQLHNFDSEFDWDGVSLNFDKVNSYASLLGGNPPQLQGTVAFSVCSWLAPKVATQEDDPTWNSFVFAFGRDRDEEAYHFHLSNTYGSGCYLGGRDADTVSAEVSLPEDVFSHVCVVVDGKNSDIEQSQTWYANGELQATSTGIATFLGHGDFLIGKELGLDHYFGGRIRDFLVWNQTLTLEEIQFMYTAKNNILRLDAGNLFGSSGDTLTNWPDLSGLGNDFALHGMASKEDWDGSALYFDGADNYASAVNGNPEGLRGNVSFTACAWVIPETRSGPNVWENSWLLSFGFPDDETNTGYSFHLSKYAAYGRYWTDRGDSPEYTTIAADLDFPTDAFTHICVVVSWNSTEKGQKWYVDAELAGWAPSAPMDLGADAFHIGKDMIAGDYFQGSVKGLTVWDFTLSLEEIQLLYYGWPEINPQIIPLSNVPASSANDVRIKEVYVAAAQQWAEVDILTTFSGTVHAMVIEKGEIADISAYAVLNLGEIHAVTSQEPSSFNLYDLRKGREYFLYLYGLKSNGKGMPVDPVKVYFQTAPDPPNLEAAAYSSTGGFLTVTFDSPTDRASGAGVSTTFDCEEIFLFHDATQQCMWVSSTQLSFMLSESMMNPGDQLTLLDNRVKSECMEGPKTNCRNWPFVMNTTVEIEPPSTVVEPVIVLKYAANIGLCSDLHLDASGSYGSGGRSLNYQWHVSSEDQEDMDEINSLIAALDSTTSELIVPSAYLSPNYHYEVVLNVTNQFGVSALQHANVTVHNETSVYEVLISGPLDQRMSRSSELHLSAISSLSSCATPSETTSGSKKGKIIQLDASDLRSFKESSSNTWHDLSGGGNNFTLFNFDEADWDGNSLLFDGTDNYAVLTTGNPEELQGDPAFTVCAWLQPFPIADWDYGSWVFDFGSYRDNGAYRLHVSNRLFYGAYWGDHPTDVPEVVFPDGSFSHVCISVNGTSIDNIQHWYINGSLLRTQDGVDAEFGSGGFQIGKALGLDQYFKGRIREFLVWNYALTTTEVIEQYSGGNILIHLNARNKISYNPADPSVWKDQSGRGNDFSLHGFEEEDFDGESLYFDRLDNYASLLSATPLELQGSASFSVCSWVLTIRPGTAGMWLFAFGTPTVFGSYSFHLSSDYAFGEYQGVDSTPERVNLLRDSFAHVCVVVEAGQSQSLYLNGTLVATASAHRGELGDGDFLLGRGLGDASEEYFVGKIREFMVWDIMLSSQDVLSYYEASIRPEPERPGKLQYKWYFDDEYISHDVNPRDLRLPAYSLDPGSYSISVEVTDPSGIVGSAQAEIEVEAAPLVAVISGGQYRKVSASSAVTLDASQSYDKNTANGTIEGGTHIWTCENDVGADCRFDRAFAGATSVVTINPDTLFAGDLYIFTVTVSDGVRSSSATVTIDVKPEPMPTIDVKMTAMRFDELENLGPNFGLILEGSVNVDNTEAPSWEDGVATSVWDIEKYSSAPFQTASTIEAVSLTQLSIELANQVETFHYLVIGQDQMVGGGSYVFIFSAMYTGVNNSALCQVTVSTNKPPTSGTLLISPGAGESITDVFDITTTGWSDDPEDYPLTYTFSYTDEELEEVLLRCSVSANKYEKAHLPPGYNGLQYLLEVKASAIDVNGAAATTSKEVSVLPHSADPSHSLITETNHMFMSLLEMYDTDNVYALLQSYVAFLRTPDCSAAPDCDRFNRNPCETGLLDNTCGACYSGYVGSVADLDTECYLPADACQNGVHDDEFESDVDCGGDCAPCDSGMSCVADTDCSLGTCENNRCKVTTEKACPNGCSNHGTCQLLGPGGLEVEKCLLSDAYCSATCVCDEGYYGTACSMSSFEWWHKHRIAERLAAYLELSRIYRNIETESLSQAAAALESLSSVVEYLAVPGKSIIHELLSDMVKESLEVSTYQPTIQDFTDTMSQVFDFLVETGERDSLSDTMNRISKLLLAIVVPGQEPMTASSAHVKFAAAKFDSVHSDDDHDVEVQMTSDELQGNRVAAKVHFDIDDPVVYDAFISELTLDPYEVPVVANGLGPSFTVRVGASETLYGTGSQVEITVPNFQAVEYDNGVELQGGGKCVEDEMMLKYFECGGHAIEYECIGEPVIYNATCTIGATRPGCLVRNNGVWDANICQRISHNTKYTVCACSFDDLYDVHSMASINGYAVVDLLTEIVDVGFEYSLGMSYNFRPAPTFAEENAVLLTMGSLFVGFVLITALSSCLRFTQQKLAKKVALFKKIGPRKPKRDTIKHLHDNTAILWDHGKEKSLMRTKWLKHSAWNRLVENRGIDQKFMNTAFLFVVLITMMSWNALLTVGLVPILKREGYEEFSAAIICAGMSLIMTLPFTKIMNLVREWSYPELRLPPPEPEYVMEDGKQPGFAHEGESDMNFDEDLRLSEVESKKNDERDLYSLVDPLSLDTRYDSDASGVPGQFHMMGVPPTPHTDAESDIVSHSVSPTHSTPIPVPTRRNATRDEHMPMPKSNSTRNLVEPEVNGLEGTQGKTLSRTQNTLNLIPAPVRKSGPAKPHPKGSIRNLEEDADGSTRALSENDSASYEEDLRNSAAIAIDISKDAIDKKVEELSGPGIFKNKKTPHVKFLLRKCVIDALKLEEHMRKAIEREEPREAEIMLLKHAHWDYMSFIEKRGVRWVMKDDDEGGADLVKEDHEKILDVDDDTEEDAEGGVVRKLCCRLFFKCKNCCCPIDTTEETTKCGRFKAFCKKMSKELCGWIVTGCYILFLAYWMCVFGVGYGPDNQRYWAEGFLLAFAEEMCVLLPVRLYVLYVVMPCVSTNRVDIHRVHQLPKYAPSILAAQRFPMLPSSELVLGGVFDEETMIRKSQFVDTFIVDQTWAARLLGKLTRGCVAATFATVLLVPTILQDFLLEIFVAAGVNAVILGIYLVYLQFGFWFWACIGMLFVVLFGVIGCGFFLWENIVAVCKQAINIKKHLPPHIHKTPNT